MKKNLLKDYPKSLMYCASGIRITEYLFILTCIFVWNEYFCAGQWKYDMKIQKEL